MAMTSRRGRFAATLLTVALPLAAAAQQPSPTAAPQHAQEWWLRPKVAAALELTPQQREKVAAAEASYRDARQAAMRAYTKAFAAFVAALEGAGADTPRVAEKRRELLDAWNAVGAANADRLVSLMGALSSDQIATLTEVAPAVLRAGPIAVRALGTVAPRAPQPRP